MKKEQIDIAIENIKTTAIVMAGILLCFGALWLGCALDKV